MSPSVCPGAIVMVGIMEGDCSANVVICTSLCCNLKNSTCIMTKNLKLCRDEEKREKNDRSDNKRDREMMVK